MVLGGAILTFIGGYKGKSTICLMIIIYLISFFTSLGIPLSSDLKLFSLFVFITCILQTICENMTVSVSFDLIPKNLSGYYSGIGSFIVSVTSMIPAPFFYGFIKTKFNSGNIATWFVICYSIVGLLELSIVYFWIKK